MRRLPFKLHDFTRISWVSDSARAIWEPRTKRIMNAWLEIEWRAITAGVRSCCIALASPQQFIERAPKWAQVGLNALPFAMVGSTGDYSSTSAAVEYGKPFAFRFVLGSPQHVSEFKEAWEMSDDRAIGAFLGYPACCRDFFKRVWVDDGLVDTTWPMAGATPGSRIEDTVIEVSSTPKANILWRWMGVRAVSHLPCSFSCEATVELADRFVEVGRAHGFDEEMDWMLEILDWPAEWSALHGIAEIKTPILKVSTRTDATPCKYTVRYMGRSMPCEGARGLRFPFSVPSSPVLTESESFRQGLKNPIGDQPDRAQWYATDNGFSTVAAMEISHEPILRIANSVLATNPGTVLDLGCGNGVLLQRLLDANPSIVPFGVDLEASRIAHARELLPRFADNFVAGDLLDLESIWPEGRSYALALLMPGRLLEATPDRAAQLRTRLRSQCDRVLIYAYGDWLTRHGTLKGLAAATGFELVDTDNEQAAGFAEVIGFR
jgi:methyltransferase family protein